MGTTKITSWNVEHLNRLMKDNLTKAEQKRRDAIVREVRELSPDILCLLEGPKPESIDRVSNEWLEGEWVAVKADDGEYGIQGDQWIWFLVRTEHRDRASLLPTEIYDALAGRTWKVHFWGEFEERNHRHFRHPQVLVLDWDGFRVEFVGLHLKSKFVNEGEEKWKAGGAKRKEFIRESLTARIKMASEAANVRAYVDAKFGQVEKPAVFVMGDLNDGPGKEFFEEQFLFFDLISNLEGDVFFARRFLNHALFDFAGNLRFSVTFEDFVDPTRDPHILLDHILFTQGLTDGSLPWTIGPGAGKVEHEVHDLINAPLPKNARTSDHKPVSVSVATSD